MTIVETRTWLIAKFTIRQQPRFDNPYWAKYSVYVNGKLIGNSFSVPDLGCCEWLERTNGVYAEPSQQAKTEYGYTAVTERRRAAMA